MMTRLRARVDRLLCALCPLPASIVIEDGETVQVRERRTVGVYMAHITPNDDDYSYLVIPLEDIER